jgi:hypothetical protein
MTLSRQEPFARRSAVRAAASTAAAAFALAIGAPAPAQAQEPAELGFDADARAADSGNFLGGLAEETAQAGAVFVGAWAGQPTAIDRLRVTLAIDEDFDGLALATDQEECTASGTTLTCDFTDVTTVFSAWAAFDLVTAPDVAVDEVAEYDLTVQADDRDPVAFPGRWHFVPGGGEPSEFEVYVPDIAVLEPGASAHPPVTFQYHGDDAPEDLLFHVSGPMYYLWKDYIETTMPYSNCGTSGGDVVCVLEGLAPQTGDVFELSPDTPVFMTPDENAPGPMPYSHQFHVEPVDERNQDVVDGIDYFDADTALVFEPSDAEGVPFKFGMMLTSGANPFDLEMADHEIRAGAGDEAVVDLTFTNIGTADALIHPTPQDVDVFEPFMIAVQLPSGAEVTQGDPETGFFSTPNRHQCQNIAIADWVVEDGSERYGVERLDVLCWSLSELPIGESLTVELPVEVTSDAPSRDGLAVAIEPSVFWGEEFLNQYGLSKSDFPVVETDLENNTAVLGLNPAGLPDTGTSLTPIGVAGALVLAAGAACFVLTRRITVPA